MAETLSTAKNTSVAGMVEAGILESKAGKVRLLRPEELPEDWDPASDRRLPVWEVVHHLVRVLESGGETGAAQPRQATRRRRRNRPRTRLPPVRGGRTEEPRRRGAVL